MSSLSRLTSTRLLARNTLWNLLGQVAPMLVGLVTIPALIRWMGIDRFGVLTLAWMVVGYFSLFDFGLARALTKLVAERLGTRAVSEVAPVTWTALALMGALGLAGAATAAALSPWLVRSVLRIPPELHGETLTGFYLLALSIPVVIGTAGFRAVLEATQRFGVVNAMRIPMGVFTFAGPALALLFSNRLDVSVAVLVVGRLVAALVHGAICWGTLPELMRPVRARRDLIRPLLTFGGWMTVSNIVSPLMVYVDRFVIGSLLSVAAVTYYVTPYEVISKMLVIPGALSAVLFPAFSMSLSGAPERAVGLLDKGLRYIFLATFPLTLAVVALAHPGLELWLGADFAARSTRVLQWLAAGVFVNGLALMPFTFLHGAGRSDLTAKLHLLELPLYLGALWWAVGAFGIEGVAVVWVGRVVLDAAALLAVTRVVMGAGNVLLRAALAVGLASPVLLGAALLNGGGAGLLSLGGGLALFAFVAWRALLEAGEREFVRLQLLTLGAGASAAGGRPGIETKHHQPKGD